MGVLAGFIFTVILYTLRYNAANEFDSSPSISDGLRNLVLQHANSTPFRKHYLGRVVSVDTMAVVRHTKQQSALIQKACSIGYSASQRRPTELTAEQSAAIDDDPEIQQLLQRRRYLRERNSISPVTRKKLESITKSLQSLRVKLRRERKNEYRAGWSRKQAVVDIEKQLAGHAFDQAPTSSLDESDPFAQEQHPAQKRLVEALTAPVPDTLEGEYRRRDNAVLAVMAYCAVQEPPSLQARKASNIKIGSAFENAEETQASEDIGTAIASVFTKDREERSRRCFLCVGRATTLQPSDPAIERLINPFYSPGDLKVPSEPRTYRELPVSKSDDHRLSVGDELQIADCISFLAHCEEGVTFVSTVTLREHSDRLGVILAGNTTPSSTVVAELTKVMAKVSQLSIEAQQPLRPASSGIWRTVPYERVTWIPNDVRENGARKDSCVQRNCIGGGMIGLKDSGYISAFI
ncbi:C2H2 finger domain-containing protein [Fusarium denticulatum]|uniref:C2H2 finger domain-containing protein n=1 Tax=Fusarium denticulatum TaxID=48507 RepID=A0A8H5TUM0_9HYPO|nr:C2H2 finger domain-containing protein [Fusarium denticulatum]